MKPPEIDNTLESAAEFGVLCTLAALAALAAAWMWPSVLDLP